MPTPKYVCEYCEKQFQDTPSARRRHLQGVQHQRAKQAWFDSFKDPEQLLSENKKLCAQYMRTGNCHYGPRCKYLHLRQPQHAMGEQQSGESLGDTSRDAEGRRPSSTTIIAENITLSTHNTQSDGISGVMASRLVESDLPPSLRPPPEGGYPPLPPIDWG
ncbi:hypothetical protein O6H91_06G052500 [Diphasiastrum complanatum]|uniref:Uncharacterized protein n=1 Tax=Diphasiastrum complanatum TaxID=34168 RepID=A0ACC2DDX1_DIPCM|nr:hypothetical protein O6H91_06G052500 [Diphasiastrum complanatum]